MTADDSDWRLAGQVRFLQGAEFTRRPYRVWSETWEHDHCEFCWAKFMDPNFSDQHRKHIAEHSDVLTEGYTTTASHQHGADYHWICPTCFEDFAERFGWQAVPPTGDSK